MGAPQLTEQDRKKLHALLAEDRPDSEKFMERLRELRERDNVQACSAILHLLAHLELPEIQAERLLSDLLRHRDQVTRALGRDPGLRVATIDYLSNVKKLLANPTIVERSQLERTERSAVTDALTRLYNRRYFMSALALEVRRSHRYSLRLSLLMIDLDEFKLLNDRHGHLFGDLVLQRLGQIMRRALRDADLPCRYGGEEFAVILPETDRLGAYAVAERIRQKTDQVFSEGPVAGKMVTVEFSAGIASLPEDGLDPATLIARADQALYQSKRNGKNRVSLYHSERRRAIRYPARASARIGLVTSDGAPILDARLIDLSLEGALLELEEGAPAAPEVELILHARSASGERQEWICAGRGVRLEKRGDAPGPFQLAVQFVEPLSQECLKQQITRARKLPEVLGGRA